MEQDKDSKTAWIVFGANSLIAKALISLLESKNILVFPVFRDQKIDFKKIKSYENLKLNIVMFNGKVFFKKFLETKSQDIAEIIDSNFTSTVTFLQRVFSEDLNVKKVFYIGSRAGQVTGHHKYFSMYAASKNAVLGLFRTLSAEFSNILFTYYICPSTDTGIFDRGVVDKDLLQEVKSKENTIKNTPEKIAEFIFENLEKQTQNFENLILD
jgi:short-subunit dehydrogenase